MDLFDLYDRGSSWAAGKIPAALDSLDRPTPCDEWTVRLLLDHMVSVHQVFQARARGEKTGPPTGAPPEVTDGDPVARYEDARKQTVAAFRQPGALERTGPLLGIASVDQLVHGWDLAKATGQDTTMPPDLANAAYELVKPMMNPDGVPGAFKPAIVVPDDAPAQDKLLALMGRGPR